MWFSLILRARPVIVVLATLAVDLPLHAGVISGDFKETLDLPDFASLGARVLERRNVVPPGLGPELSETNQVSNPSGWLDSLMVDFNPTSNLLSLTPTSFDDYQTITISLTNLVFSGGDRILKVIPISLNSAVVPERGRLTQANSFTADSITISYTSLRQRGDTFAFQEGGIDTYQILVGTSAVPEPATFYVCCIGLGALPLIARHHRRRCENNIQQSLVRRQVSG